MKTKTFPAVFLLLAVFLSLSLPAVFAQEFNTYDQNWMRTGRIRDGKIFDLDMKVEGYIKDGRIFDKNWMLKGFIEGDRMFDVNRHLQGYIEKRHAGPSKDDEKTGGSPRQ